MTFYQVLKISFYEYHRLFLILELTVWLSNNASQALVSLCSSNKTILECTPVTLAKALKNPVEIQGFKSCHVRDAAALCSYFAWLEKEIPKGKTYSQFIIDNKEHL